MSDSDIEPLLILALGALALYVLAKTGSGNASLANQEGSFPSTPPGSLTGVLGTAFNSLFPNQLSAEGVAFIQTQEGLQLTAYPDSHGYSIGYGHHITGNEAAVIGINLGPGSTISQTQANALFMADIQGAENAVNQNVSVPLTQGQFDALVDFTYNEGIGALESSTLLQELNAGNYQGAASEFAQWNISNGKVNPVLVARREAEAALFL